MAGAELQRGDAEDTGACTDIRDFITCLHVLLQLADAELGSLMHAGAEGGTRIDRDDELIPILLRNGFPGRLDQEIPDGKRVEEGLPVIDPVLILCVGGIDRAEADIDILLHLIEGFLHLLKQLLQLLRSIDV